VCFVLFQKLCYNVCVKYWFEYAVIINVFVGNLTDFNKGNLVVKLRKRKRRRERKNINTNQGRKGRRRTAQVSL
jgi:hypothetical protein